MAASRRRCAVLAVLAVVAFLAAASAASAVRPAPAAATGAGAAAAYLQQVVVYPAAVVEKARETVEMLMARLPAGPSPRGPGH
ncbi:hypothetical protein BS78_02G241600, partial [Paspalum vaginatum]